MLGAVLKARVSAGDMYGPAAIFNALAKSWAMMNKDPDQLTEVPRALIASSEFANPTKKPGD